MMADGSVARAEDGSNVDEDNSKRGSDVEKKGRIQVVVCDPHPIVRAGIRFALGQSEEISVIGETGDGAQIEPLVTELQPDIVLMAMSLPNVDGVEAMRRIRATSPDVKVLILTTFANRKYVEQVLAEGGSGYLLKLICDETCLVQAVKSVSQGNVVLSDMSASLLFENRRGDGSGEFRHRLGLTHRQVSVLKLAARGLMNKEIANAMNVSEGTIKGYMSEIYQELGVRSRAEAVITGIRFGIISPFEEQHDFFESDG